MMEYKKALANAQKSLVDKINAIHQKYEHEQRRTPEFYIGQDSPEDEELHAAIAEYNEQLLELKAKYGVK